MQSPKKTAKFRFDCINKDIGFPFHFLYFRNMQVNQVFTLAEMNACFELIQQLQPWLKKEKYLESLAQMIQHNYSQLIVNDEYGNPIGVSGVWINY